MQGFPPAPEDRVTIANWQDPPFNRWSFSHLRELVPTQAIGAMRRTSTNFADFPRELGDVQVTRADGHSFKFDDLIERSYTDAVLVVHDDQIVYENYFGETHQHTNHLLMSVTKSVVGCVAANLIAREAMSKDDKLTDLIPELADSGYAQATVRDVLDMRSGIKFSEDYTKPEAEVRVMEEAFGWRPNTESVPNSIYGYLTQLEKASEHGDVFNYRSCETLVLGWACERAAGARMADLISEFIWQPMGAQHAAEITCDSLGTAIHDGGMCASARDMARFGQMLLHRGTVDGVEVVPADWMRNSWKVDPDIRDAFARSDSGPYLPGGWYRNQFWFLPRKHGDVLLCLGIYGQMVYVNPGTKTVAVKFSTWPDAQNPELLHDTFAAFDAAGAHLAGLSDKASHEGTLDIASGRKH